MFSWCLLSFPVVRTVICVAFHNLVARRRTRGATHVPGEQTLLPLSSPAILSRPRSRTYKMKADRPFLKSFACAGGLFLGLVAWLFFQGATNISYRIGYTMSGCL